MDQQCNAEEIFYQMLNLSAYGPNSCHTRLAWVQLSMSAEQFISRLMVCVTL